MSEDLPLSLRMKLYSKYLKMLKEKEEHDRGEVKSPKDIVLEHVVDERARELLRQAEEQYPEATNYAISVVAELIKQGVIKEIDGELMLALLNRLGVPVRPEVRIRFVKRGGREVSLKEYLED